MVTRSAAESLRGMEFQFNLNILKVALCCIRYLTLVVGSFVL